MKSFSSAEFIGWMDRLAGLPWPLTIAQFADHSAALGWSTTVDPEKFETHFDNGSPYASIHDFNGSVHQVRFNLVAPGAGGAERTAQLLDLFADLAEAGTAAWGTPVRRVRGSVQRVGWNVSGGCLAVLTLTGRAVSAAIRTPDGVPYMEWE